MAAVLASPENDADRRASKDLPHLSLSLESPPSSSPFPSPSSSFIPPPMPGAHEYANKLPIHVSKKKQRDSADGNASKTAPAPVATTPTTAAPSAASASASPASANPPATANGTAKARWSRSPEEMAKLLQELNASMDVHERMREHMANAAKRVSRASLNSSRPAPPSPSVSRRASGAHNLNNVSASGNNSIFGNSRTSVSLSRANSSATASHTNTPGAAARRRSRGIKIRDFAYPAHDLRHTGQGPDAPRPGRSRPASQYGQYGLDGDPNNSRRNSGWGAFRWAGSKLWGFALGNGGNNGKQRAGASTGGEDVFVPTSSDFARNFDASSPHEEYPPSGFHGASESEYDYEDRSEADEADTSSYAYPDQDVPLLPGLYRAMYAFVPEGTAEMALAEDQVVRIVGRGGGVGWAVAEDEAGRHALVPESYLEVVQLDEEVETGED